MRTKTNKQTKKDGSKRVPRPEGGGGRGGGDSETGEGCLSKFCDFVGGGGVGSGPTLYLPQKRLVEVSTETVGLLGTGAQDVHVDFHTAPEL